MPSFEGLHYVDLGPRQASALVFLHAFPLSSKMWTEQLSLVAEAGYRVIAPDNRGLGQSELGEAPYFVDFFADDLLKLLDHLKLERVSLCGISMGGYTALRVYERERARVDRLILCDTRADADSNDGRLKRADLVRLLRRKGLAFFARLFSKNLLGETSFRDRPALVEKVQSWIQEASSEAIAWSLGALASRNDSTQLLDEISCPTLVICGAEENPEFKSAAQIMHSRIKSSELVWVEKSGHLPALENPGAFNSALLSFLRTC